MSLSFIDVVKQAQSLRKVVIEQTLDKETAVVVSEGKREYSASQSVIPKNIGVIKEHGFAVPPAWLKLISLAETVKSALTKRDDVLANKKALAKRVEELRINTLGWEELKAHQEVGGVMGAACIKQAEMALSAPSIPRQILAAERLADIALSDDEAMLYATFIEEKEEVLASMLMERDTKRKELEELDKVDVTYPLALVYKGIDFVNQIDGTMLKLCCPPVELTNAVAFFRNLKFQQDCRNAQKGGEERKRVRSKRAVKKARHA